MNTGTSTAKEPDKRFIPIAPSASGLVEIIKRAVELGRVSWTTAFKRRCRLRGKSVGFNVIDVTRVLKSGNVITEPRYEPKWDAFSFELASQVEGRRFVVSILLHCDHDYSECPLLSIRTANFQRGNIRKSRKTRNNNKAVNNEKDNGAKNDDEV